MKNQLRPALVSVALFTLVTGFLFPGAVTAVAALAFPKQAHGSLVVKAGKVIGSTLIGQNFTKPEYFHPRPSAAGNGFDGTSSGSTNLGPTSAKLRTQQTDLTSAYRTENTLDASGTVPVDAVTRSASGLDPHISPENALLQAARVAKARGKSLESVKALVAQHTEGRTFGVLGEPRVNVLALNLALDGLQ
ncbi:potassium-transporting ATPase subunit KdpC [Armatimonas rosea]|uniref:Potassium-transporting ATPase KdpC subunit n=1 Tax=Armatimonas rosea TaxID=685828 RepID=A0A7W9SSV3_ARMRO|nr:potassium-transporting ATPase subunit KdpC [Armatimonas rosea]MBB6052211.1 K+-transporting ATPase ATPase C chain [Armatimonas rosea]